MGNNRRETDIPTGDPSEFRAKQNYYSDLLNVKDMYFRGTPPKILEAAVVDMHEQWNLPVPGTFLQDMKHITATSRVNPVQVTDKSLRAILPIFFGSTAETFTTTERFIMGTLWKATSPLSLSPLNEEMDKLIGAKWNLPPSRISTFIDRINDKFGYNAIIKDPEGYIVNHLQFREIAETIIKEANPDLRPGGPKAPAPTVRPIRSSSSILTDGEEVTGERQKKVIVPHFSLVGSAPEVINQFVEIVSPPYKSATRRETCAFLLRHIVTTPFSEGTMGSTIREMLESHAREETELVLDTVNIDRLIRDINISRDAKAVFVTHRVPGDSRNRYTLGLTEIGKAALEAAGIPVPDSPEISAEETGHKFYRSE